MEFEVYITKAINNIYQGKFEESIENLKKSRMFFDYDYDHKHDFKMFRQHSFEGVAYYYLGNYKKAKEHFDVAIDLANSSDVDINDLFSQTFAILTALKLGELKLHKVKYNGDSIDIDKFFSSNPKEFQYSSNKDLATLYYNLYQIYDFTDNEELSNKYLNLAHKELMKVSKKLRKSDRKNFLEKNLMNQDIISLWKQMNI
tara:strand:- start:172 stop:774 length:603 start_codon:yes stop_codon:yes gene_type:complete